MKRMWIPLMLLLGGAPALAQTVSPSRVEARRESAERRLDGLASRLGLDEATAAKVRATFEKYRAELGPLRKSMWQSRRALEGELGAAKPDQARVAQLGEQLASARQQLQAVHARRQAELKEELTPEQYAKLLVGRQALGRGAHRHGRARGESSSRE